MSTATITRPETIGSPVHHDEPRDVEPPSRRGALARLVRGRPEDPAWARPALLALLAATALLYLWNLGSSGWANSFYSSAVQAGTRSWKAFFFGSSDASNFITVDKPPAALWVMELSARVFGLSSWSVLVPQALEGVASVALLYATVRRWFGASAGLIAGAVLATTPVATLMFRFNNPDSLLVLLLLGATYATVRAIEDGRTAWLVLATSLVGLGFIDKMLQAFLVMPAIGLVYLLAGPPKLARRIGQLAWAGLALVVSSGWWVAAVALTPASMRPYIGGSQDNSIVNLILGYNGFGRLTGNEAGSVGGGGTTGSMWGATGWSRMFNSEFGGQISWLIPAALVFLAVVLWRGRHAPRTDRLRAAFLLWGGILLVTGLVFSYAAGIIHPYYTVALAPAIGALVGMGSVTLWRRRDDAASRVGLVAAITATAAWAAVLLYRSPNWMPWLRPVVLLVGLGAAFVVAVTSHLRGRLALATAAAALLIGIAGPLAYSVTTARTAHSGALPSAGPAVVGGRGGPGGGGGFGGMRPTGTGTGGFAAPFGTAPGGARGAGGGFGGMGGFLDSSTPSATVVAELKAGASGYRWVLATVNSNSAAGYQLATGDPVMAIGGFNGTDPAPTLAEFQALVKAHRIHWFVAGGGMGSGGTGTTASQITAWVEAHFKTTTVGGTTLYDLTSPTS
jgi:4-amino-4-deoxy-L-arabinose transferase-like glycosyltransferase